MTTDERLDAVARNLDMLTKIHLDHDREYNERFEKLTTKIDDLTDQVTALTADVKTLSGLVRQDGEHIRALARIAELHAQRLDRLEDR